MSKPSVYRSRSAVVMLTASLLGLPACTIASEQTETSAQDQQLHDRQLAQRYDADRANGMAGVINDVQQCYSQAGGIIALQDQLRDCMLLDAVGAREDKAAARAFGVTLPYYTQQAKAQRWGRYGQKAGFPTPQQLLAFMANGSQRITALRTTGLRP